MSIVMDAVNWFLGLGSAVFVPIIMFVLAVSFGGGIAKSIRSALYIGIGLTALNMVINLSVEAMTPVTQGLSSRLNVDFSTMDIGYGNVNVAWGWAGVLAVIVGILIINVICLSLKLTKTLWVDMWNIWHGEAVAVTMWAFTGNIVLGVASGLLLLTINMFLADHHAKAIQEFNGLDGVAVVATSGTFTASFAELLMKVINRIPGLKDVDASPEQIKDKFGIFGEMAVVGSILGIIMGVIAGSTVTEILGLAITLATVLVVLPKMLSLIAEGIIPISNDLSKFMKKRFPGRELNIAVDPAILLGDPSVMSTVILMYPISILLAALLPGNNWIPVASLAALPYWIGGMVPYTKGNIIHTVIIATLWIIPATLIAANLAPITTEAARMSGLFADQIAKGAVFTNWDEGGNILMWLLVKLGALFGM